MTELLSDLATPSDAELISSVRGGDVTAYGELFSRHKDAANRLARQLVRGPDSDDLVSEAFAKVLSVIQGGGGPDVAFRAYLLTAVRRLHVDKMRAGARLQPSDDMSVYDAGVPFQDTAVAAFESGAAAKAFATLPERWQLVLWHLEVEGQKPADIAPLLGMSPNSVSALAYRAREGLRQAFLTMHLNDISETDCRWVNEHLGAYVRKGLSNRDSTKVQAHLDQCRRCTAMYLELTEVNSNLAGIIAPLLLGAAATGYLASSGAAVGGLGVVGTVFGRVRDVVTANAGAATAAGVAAGVAAVATAGVMLMPTDTDRVIEAKDPVGVASPAAPSSAPKPSASPTERERRSQEPSPSDDPTPSQEPTPTDVPVVATTPGVADETPDPPIEESTPPAPAGPISSDVSFAAPVTFDGDLVSFTVSGDPLPPTIGLELVSDPSGIGFRDNGSSCTLTSDTTATCSTGALARGSAMQRAVAAAPRSFSDSIPLRIPADQPESQVRLVVTVPEGYADPSDGASNSSSFQYKPARPAQPTEPAPPAPAPAPPPAPPAPPTQPEPPVTPPTLTADVALEATALVTATPDANGNYSLTTRVTGTAGLPYVRLTVSSAVGISSVSAGCLVEDTSAPQTVRCDAPADPLDVTLTLVPTLPISTTTPLTLSVAAPPEYDETDTNDNAGIVDLQPAPVDAPFAFVDGPTAELTRANEFRVRAVLSGVPATATGITFELLKVNSGGEAPIFLVIDEPDGCTATGGSLTCPAPEGGDVVLDAEARLPGFSLGAYTLRVEADGQQMTVPVAGTAATRE